MYPVLIVEDEKPIADLIDLTLRRMQYQCVKVYSGEDAAGLIVNRRFDLILLDVMLPGIDGFALMDYIAPTGTPVIFLTARDSVADRVRGCAWAPATISSSPLRRRSCWRGWTA